MSNPKVIWEHPDDWNMGEADFAKACSRLANRLISLADKSSQRRVSDYGDAPILERIDEDVRAMSA